MKMDSLESSSVVLTQQQLEFPSLSTPPPAQVVVPPPVGASDTPDGIQYIGTVSARSASKGRKRAAASTSATPATVRISEFDNTRGGVDERQVLVVEESMTDKNARARQNERVRRQYSKDQSSRLRGLLAPQIHEWVNTTGNKKQPNEGQLMFLACEKIDMQRSDLEAKDRLLEEKEAEIKRIKEDTDPKIKGLKNNLQRFINGLRTVSKGLVFYKSRYTAQCEAQNTQPEAYYINPDISRLLHAANAIQAQQQQNQTRFLSLEDLAKRQQAQASAAAGCQGAQQLPQPFSQTPQTTIRIKQESDQGQTQNQDVVRNNIRVTGMLVNPNGVFYQPIRVPLPPQQAQQLQRFQIGPNPQFQQQKQQFVAQQQQQQQRQLYHRHFLQQGVQGLKIAHAPGQSVQNATVFASNPQVFHQQQAVAVPQMPTPPPPLPQNNLVTVKQEPLDMPDVGEAANPLFPNPLFYNYATATTRSMNTEQKASVAAAVKPEPPEEEEDTEQDEEDEANCKSTPNSTTTTTHSPPSVSEAARREPAVEKQQECQFQQQGFFSMPGFREDLNSCLRPRTYPQHPTFAPNNPPPGEEREYRVLTAEVLLDDENVFKKMFPNFKDFVWHDHLEKKEDWKSELNTIEEDLIAKTLKDCEETLDREKEQAEQELEIKNKIKGNKRTHEDNNEPKKRGRKKKYTRR